MCDNIKDIIEDDKRLDQGKGGSQELDKLIEAWRNDIDD